jgi:hypothetical protein
MPVVRVDLRDESHETPVIIAARLPGLAANRGLATNTAIGPD